MHLQGHFEESRQKAMADRRELQQEKFLVDIGKQVLYVGTGTREVGAPLFLVIPKTQLDKALSDLT